MYMSEKGTVELFIIFFSKFVYNVKEDVVCSMSVI